MSIDPSAIPVELKACPHWVCWRWEIRDGKRTKVPRQAFDPKREAKSNDPTTWAPFAQAVKVFERSKRNGYALAGIGFVVTPEDGLVGIDLDKCRDPTTGEIEPWAQDILAAFDTYCEVTPSGTGFRIWLKGKLPPGGRRKGQLEMYDSGRYFTVTGQRVPDKPAEIRDCQNALDALHARTFPTPKKTPTPASKPAPALSLSDSELVNKAFAAKNGAEFRDLWNGNTAAYQGDHSAADLALCSHLLFWTGGDSARADQLFRQSGLMRAKWDKRHFSDGEAYGEHTMTKAASTVTDFYEARQQRHSEPPTRELPPIEAYEERSQTPDADRVPQESVSGFRFLSASEVLADPKSLAFAIHGVIPDDAITFLVGDFGTCKTVLGIDWALHIALGKPWRGKPVKQGPVFFILGEGHSGFANRVRAWCIRNQVDPKELEGKLFVSNAPGDLVDPEAARAVMKSIHATGVTPAAIFVDTLARNFGAGDENSTRDANTFYNNIDAYLRRPFKAAVLVTHHVGHLERDRAKGARQLISNADAKYLITACDDYVELTCKKAKDFQKPEPFAFNRRIVELGFQDTEGKTATSIVLDSTDVHSVVHTNVHTGKTEDSMLAVLDELWEIVRENREEGGYDPEVGRVSLKHWRETLEERGIVKSRSHFWNLKTQLDKKKLIEIDGLFVKPAKRTQ